ncbi:alkaline phosphatase family protein [Caldisericum exile]|uniref:Alkaline phosphatase family protein n=1 Tax=Caldisericum exile (strain DSM 21853 / NBRC 104410 / AZM16c01) TaxID=511051 RepID=A0A7U6GF20_CALEA|nr:alkaline phosphatase family protein [Caldisericum exile]BAL81203.1 hypothetical protein CSE_10770 [Caldisericum exile AZM16c01]
MFIDTLKQIKSESKINGFITPVYNGLNISNIGSLILENFEIQNNFEKLTITQILKVPKKKKVIFFLIDAFGFNLLSFAREKVLLESFEEIIKNGIFTVLTSTFPSTTATALPSIYTISEPGTHGVLGYRFYTREFGNLINPLFQKLSVNKNCPIKYDEDWLIPIKTIFEILNENNIPNYSIVRSDYLTSTFDKAVYRGTKELGYLTLSDLYNKIVELLKLDTIFINAYWWSIDALSHHYGPYSQVVISEIKFLDYFLRLLLEKIDNDTLLIISADHGQIDTSNGKVIKLKEEKDSENILLPVSDVRAPYIYTNGKLQKAFFEKFDNITALTKEDALNLGLFGNTISFEERIGDYIILFKDNSYVDFISEESELNLLGKHGNLTEDEMVVPLILYYK